MLIIGIAGGTASGKTVFAKQLFEELVSFKPVLITLDSYYKSQDHLIPSDRANVNYDHPDSFEVSLLIKHLASLRSGEEVAAPIYDFTTHTRSKNCTKLPVTQLVILEGILTLSYQELLPLLDLKLFIETPSELRYQRRLARDIVERGRTPEDVYAQWNSTVEPMHQKYCEPSKALSDKIISGESNYQAEFPEIIKWINLKNLLM